MVDAKEGAKRIRTVAQLGNLNCGDVEMSELYTSQPPIGCSIEGPVLTRENDRIRNWKIAVRGIHGNDYVASLVFPPDYPRFSPTLAYRSRRGGGEDLVGTMIRNSRMMEGFKLSESECNPLYTDLDEELDVDLILGTWNNRITCEEMLKEIREALHEGERFFDMVDDEQGANEDTLARSVKGDTEVSGEAHPRSDEQGPADHSPRTSHALETQQSSSSGQADSLGITKRAEEPSQQGHGPHLESTPFREEAQVLLCWVTSGQHQTDAAWRFVAQCREELAARFSTSVATITDPWNPRFLIEDKMAAAWIVVPIFLQDTQGTYPRHYHGIVRSLAQQNQAALPVILSNATVDAVAADGGTGNEAAGKRGSAEQKDEDESGGERKRGAQGLVVFTEEEDTMSDVPDEVEPVWWPSDLGVPLAVSPENESEAISAASTVAALAGACFSQQRPWGQHSDSPPIFVSYCWANSLEAEETNHIPRGVLCGSDLADPRRLKRLLESHQACMLGDARPCWIDVENTGQIAEHGVLLAARNAISNSEVAVLCVSTEYAECTRCYQECELAIKRQVDGTGLCIVLALVGSDGDGWCRSSLGVMAKGYPCVDFRGVMDEEELTRAANELRRLIGRELRTAQRVSERLLPLLRDGHSDPSFEQLRFIDRARSRYLLPMVRIKSDVLDTRPRDPDGPADQTAASPWHPSPSQWAGSRPNSASVVGRVRSGAAGGPQSLGTPASGALGRTRSSSDGRARFFPDTPPVGKRGAGVGAPSPRVGRTPSSGGGAFARTSSLGSSRSSLARFAGEPEIALRAGEVCPVVRYEVEAVVTKGHTPPVDRQGELYVKEGQRVVLLRRFSVEGHGRRWLPVSDAKKRTGLVPEDHLQILKAHTRLWVRNASGVDVRCRCDNVVELTAEEASEGKRLFSVPDDEAWHSAMAREQEQTQQLVNRYQAALEQLCEQGEAQGWLSGPERMLAVNVGRCKVQDLGELLRSLPRMGTFGVDDTRAALVAEGEATSAWFEREFQRLKRKVPAKFRGEDVVRMTALKEIVCELQLMFAGADGARPREDGVMSVELETLGDAAREEELCYHRVPWAEVLVEIREACGVEEVAVEWAREQRVLASEEAWQACFDALLDDWHSPDARLRGTLRLNVYDLAHPAQLPPHVLAGLPTPEVASFDTLSLECYTFTLEPDEEGARARRKPAGSDAEVVKRQRGMSKRRVTPPLSSEQARQLERLQKRLSATRVDISLDCKWAQVREKLCKEFGFCVVPQYTPCDVLGHTLKAGRRSSTDPLLAAHLARDRTSEMIDNETKWTRAVEEVLDDWHLFHDLNGTLTVHLHLDINQDITPPAWLKRGGQTKPPPPSSSPSRPLSALSSRGSVSGSGRGSGLAQPGDAEWHPRFLGDTAPPARPHSAWRLGLPPRTATRPSEAELAVKRVVAAFDAPLAGPLAALKSAASKDEHARRDSPSLGSDAAEAMLQLLGQHQGVESAAAGRERKRRLVARNVKRARDKDQRRLQELRADLADKDGELKKVLQEKAAERAQLRKRREERAKGVARNVEHAKLEHEREVEGFMLALAEKRTRTARPVRRADEREDKERVAAERRRALVEQEEAAREARREAIYLTRAAPARARAPCARLPSAGMRRTVSAGCESPAARPSQGRHCWPDAHGPRASTTPHQDEGEGAGAGAAWRRVEAWAEGQGLVGAVAGRVEQRVQLAASFGGAVHALLAANGALRGVAGPVELAVRHGACARLLAHTARHAFVLRRCLLPDARGSARPRSPVSALLALGKSSHILKQPRSRSRSHSPPALRIPVPSAAEMEAALRSVQARFSLLSTDEAQAVRDLIPLRARDDGVPREVAAASGKVAAALASDDDKSGSEQGVAPRRGESPVNEVGAEAGAVGVQGGEPVELAGAGAAARVGDASGRVGGGAPEREEHGGNAASTQPIPVFPGALQAEPLAKVAEASQLSRKRADRGDGKRERAAGKPERVSEAERTAQRVAEIVKLAGPSVGVWSEHGERTAFVSIQRMRLERESGEEEPPQLGKEAGVTPVHYCHGCGFVLRGVNAATSHHAECRAFRLLLRSRTAERQARRLIRFTLPELGYTAEEALAVLKGIEAITELVAGVHGSSRRPPS